MKENDDKDKSFFCSKLAFAKSAVNSLKLRKENDVEHNLNPQCKCQLYLVKILNMKWFKLSNDDTAREEKVSLCSKIGLVIALWSTNITLYFAKFEY